MKTFAFVPEVFTIDAAAHYLGVSKSTMRRYIDKGDVHTLRLPQPGNSTEALDRVLIARRELDALIDRGLLI